MIFHTEYIIIITMLNSSIKISSAVNPTVVGRNLLICIYLYIFVYTCIYADCYATMS